MRILATAYLKGRQNITPMRSNKLKTMYVRHIWHFVSGLLITKMKYEQIQILKT